MCICLLAFRYFGDNTELGSFFYVLPPICKAQIRFFLVPSFSNFSPLFPLSFGIKDGMPSVMPCPDTQNPVQPLHPDT